MATQNENKANEAQAFEDSFGEGTLNKTNMTFDEVHTLNVNKVTYGEGEYGEWISMSTDTDLFFFASYEMTAIVKAIGDLEGDFTIRCLRRKKEGKNGRTYNKMFARLVEDNNGGVE